MRFPTTPSRASHTARLGMATDCFTRRPPVAVLDKRKCLTRRANSPSARRLRQGRGAAGEAQGVPETAAPALARQGVRVEPRRASPFAAEPSSVDTSASLRHESGIAESPAPSRVGEDVGDLQPAGRRRARQAEGSRRLADRASRRQQGPSAIAVGNADGDRAVRVARPTRAAPQVGTPTRASSAVPTRKRSRSTRSGRRVPFGSG